MIKFLESRAFCATEKVDCCGFGATWIFSDEKNCSGSCEKYHVRMFSDFSAGRTRLTNSTGSRFNFRLVAVSLGFFDDILIPADALQHPSRLYPLDSPFWRSELPQKERFSHHPLEQPSCVDSAWCEMLRLAESLHLVSFRLFTLNASRVLVGIQV